jgi:hypothetical protein
MSFEPSPSSMHCVVRSQLIKQICHWTRQSLKMLSTITIGSTHRVSDNGEIEAVGAVWYGQNDTQNKDFRVPDNLASPEAGDWAAILEAAKTTPRHSKLELFEWNKQDGYKHPTLILKDASPQFLNCGENM